MMRPFLTNTFRRSVGIPVNVHACPRLMLRGGYTALLRRAAACAVGAPIVGAPSSCRGFLASFFPEPKLVAPEHALPGRPQKMKVASQHYVLGTPLEGPWPEGFKVAVFANGCFWGSEKGALATRSHDSWGPGAPALAAPSNRDPRSQASGGSPAAASTRRQSATPRASHPTRRTRRRAPASRATRRRCRHALPLRGAVSVRATCGWCTIALTDAKRPAPRL